MAERHGKKEGKSRVGEQAHRKSERERASERVMAEGAATANNQIKSKQ